MNEESCSYGNAKLTLMKMWQNKKVDNKYVIQQLKLINQDIVTNSEFSSSAQDMLNYLIDLPSQDVHLEIIQFLNDDQTSEKVLETIIDSYKNKIVGIIVSNGNLFQILPPWQQSGKIDKLLTIFQKICSELSKDVSKPFFLNVIIPVLLDLDTDNCLRDIILQIADVFLMNISIRDLTLCEFDKFTADTSTKYVVAIGKLREQNYADWHKLWIFLIRFWDRQLHSSMEIINKLLRVVEFAFRSSCHQQRIKGYDCWKELIDNASLEESYICSSKQIKLLVTPLRAKFSKQEVVICKRFDVFVHLLEKLQLNATLCLSDFLEFCFGPLADNKDASKVGQGKSIPQLWSKSTKILVEIIGHSHAKASDCLFTEDVIKFKSPVITQSNFPQFYTVIIKAVGESCNLLKDANLEVRKEKVIMCMWKTVFNLIGTVPESKIPYLEVVSQVLDNFLKANYDHQYFEDFLLSILTVVVNLEQDFSCEVVKYLLKPLLTIFSRLKHVPSHFGDNFQQTIYKCFSNITLLEDKLHTMKIMMQNINETNISSENCDNVGKIWLCLGDELVWDLSVEKIEEFENFGMFFMWPAYNLQQLDDHTRKKILSCWIKLYRKMTGEDDSKKLRVMNKLQNIFKSNPLHLFNLVSLLGAISQFENKFSKEFVLHLTEIISEILQLPFIKSEEDQKLSTILVQYFDSSFEFYQLENNEDIIRNISTCLKHLISARKYFKILETFSSFLKCASNDVITKYSKYLSQFLSNVSQQDTDPKSYASKEIQKILSFFNKDPDEEKKTFVVPSGRSARIANLAKNSPKSPKKKTEKATSSSTLRLFGKDLDTLSPLKVKGSQLHSSLKNKTKKAANAIKPVKSIPLGEENSQDFVLIDSVVKFDPKKLNEHQKEVLRQRKDDIPALYQDLSQGSQDLFSSRSNSNSKDALDQEKKVIVEVIAPLQYADGGEAQDVPTIKENVSHVQNEKIIDQNEKIIDDISIEDSSKQKNSNTDNDVSLKLTVPHQTNGKYVQDIPNISKCENLQTATEPEGKCLSSESDMFGTSSNKDLKSENIFTDPMTTVSQIPSDSNIHCGTEDKSNNQPQNIISGDSKSEDLFNSELQTISYKTPSGRRKKKKNLESELNRLQMNIVGADTFTSTSRRTRPKEVKAKENNADHVKKSKGKLQKNENESESAKTPYTEFEKSSSISPKNKKSASVQKDDTSVKYKRRNTIGVARELNFEREPGLESKSKTRKEVDNKNINTDKIIGELKTRKNKQKPDYTDNSVTSNINITKTQGNVSPRKRGRPPKLKPVQAEKSARGRKRKHSSGDEDDIIESSQESFGNVTTPLLNLSKKSVKTDTSEDSTLVEQKVLTVINKGKEELYVKEIENNIPEVPLDSSQTQDLPIDLNVLQNDLNTSEQQSSLSSNDNFEAEVEEKLKSTEDSTQTPNSTTNLSKETCDFSPISIQNVSEAEQDLTKPNQENSQTELNATKDLAINTDTSQDTTQTQDSTTNVSQESTQTQELVGNEDKKDTQETLTQPTQETTDLCDGAEVCKPVIPYFDLPKKPQLTESEQFQCRMDTMSLCNDFNGLNELELAEDKKPLQILEQLEDPPATPVKNVISREKTCDNDDLLGTPSTGSIHASPVTKETPKRTMELLNNTLDISPIASQNSSSSDEGKFESCAQIPLAFEPEMEKLEDVLKIVEAKLDNQDNLNEAEKDVHKLEDDLEVETSSEENETVSLSDEGSLQDDETILVEFPNDNLNGEAKEADNISEDHSNNIENIPRSIENVAVNVPGPHFKPSTIQERSSKLLNMLNINSPKMFLKRQRLLGTSVSPSTGRIKRLMLNVNLKQNLNTHEEILEEDILTFKREIPSPLAVPRSSILKRKLVDTGDGDGISPCPKRKRVNFSDPFITSRKIFIKDDCGSNLEAKRLFDGFSEQPDDDYLKDMFEPQDNQGITESENVETEPSLEILNPFMLRKDKPIYQKLVECQDDVMVIVKKVTSPLFLNTLMAKLQAKKVRTVGDLAQMCEAEINRLPFKVPVVANVYKALDNYYLKKWGKEFGEPVVNGICDSNERRDAKVERTDVKTEMENLISRAKEENVPLEELTKVLFSKMKFSQILSLFRTQQFPLKDLVQDCDTKDLLRYIVDNIGILKIFESLKQFGDPQSFSSAVVQFSTEEPLSDVLKQRSIEDLQNVLKNTRIFNKEQLINDCLLPLINTPKDIDSYLSILSVADICTIISDRTSDDFIDILKSHIDSRNEEIKNDIMKKMFRYFDEKLKPECLIDLHIKFLERIRCDLSERCKEEF